MSPLPERRKSAEELAALRESLGIPGERPEGPTFPAQKEAIETPKSSVFEKPADLEMPKPAPKPVRSLRKSKGLVVDQPKETVAANTGKLPFRRHTDKELVGLRKTEAPPSVPPAVHLESMTARWWWLALFYGLGLVLIFLALLGGWARGLSKFDLPAEWVFALVRWENFPLLQFAMLIGSGVLMLGGAAWLRFRRPRSQHHAGILTIVAVLVLVFATLYFYPELNGA